MLKQVRSEEFKSIISKSDLPLVVDFFAPWCDPCRRMTPELEEVAREFEGLYDFLKLSVDDCPDIAAQYQVMSIPTLLFIKDSRVVGREVGFVSKEQIRSSMEKYFG